MVDEMKRQVGRLRALPRGDRQWGTEAEPGLGAELLRVMNRAARDHHHASLIIDKVMDSSQFCPTPIELREIASGVGPEKSKPIDPNCECRGIGWLLSFWLHTRNAHQKDRERLSEAEYRRLVSTSLPPTQTLYSGAERCRCRS